MNDTIQKISDTKVIVGSVATGSLGTWLQWLTDFGSLFLIGLNSLVAIFGLYLLFFKIKKARAEAYHKKKKK